MTQNRKLTKAAQARADETGVPFMAARREIEAEQLGPEPAYRLMRDQGIERFDSDGDRGRRVESRPAMWAVDTRGAWWGYGGSGPNATAKILLEDACGIDADLLLCKAFSGDVLIHMSRVLTTEWIAVEEVRAWHRERAPFLVRRAERRIELSRSGPNIAAEVELLEEMADPDPDWFRRRQDDRPPRLPSVPPLYF